MLTINNMKIFKSKFKEFLKADSSNLTPTRGFAVLFTVLISSIILAIALGITSISYQEVVLSSSAKEGNISFYAADTGADCALYWDTKSLFDTSPGQFNCANQAPPITSTGQSPFSFNLELNNNSCAVVTVDKAAVIDPLNPSDLGTSIKSLGYNVSCSSLLSQQQTGIFSPRLVERAIGVTYSTSGSPPPPPPPPPAESAL